MKPTARILKLLSPLAATLVLAFSAGCSVYARSTVVDREAPQSEDLKADEFVGTPMMGDYDQDKNLDFVLEVHDADRVFKIGVHEEVGPGNEELMEKIRQRINSMEDKGSLRVIGYYNPEYRGEEKEYGFLDLKCIVFYDDATGQEEAYFTDPQDSRYYSEGDVTVIYAPGHHFDHIYYPRYCSPWWDTDGDGIPNRYDPWPLTYDLWYDYNLNYIPDWYDPYYIGFYPYWDYWQADFWIGYRWYSPNHWWYPGYDSVVYYNDYRTYSRLYDDRLRDTRGRPAYRLDPKTERAWRQGYERDQSRRRISDSPPSPGSRFRGYENRPADNRVLVTPSRARDDGSGGDQVVATTDEIDNRAREPFNRNPASGFTPASAPTGDLNTGRVSPSAKRKTSDVPSDRAAYGRSRQTDRTSGTAANRSRTGGDDRVYSPSGATRSRSVTGTSAAGSDQRVYRGITRSRSTAPADNSRVRSSGRENTSASPAASSVNRGSSTRSRDTGGSSSSGSASSSRSRSSGSSAPAPAASGSSSRSRGSSSQPATRSSGGSTRSRDSGSSGSSSGSKSSGGSSSSGSSSGGSDRRRR
ncbi:MAG: hypothetical protein V1794_18030 [Candidatus Glassbacteria bacterium]